MKIEGGRGEGGYDKTDVTNPDFYEGCINYLIQMARVNRSQR